MPTANPVCSCETLGKELCRRHSGAEFCEECGTRCAPAVAQEPETFSPQLEQALADTPARRFEPKDFGELERLAERAARSGLFAVKSADAALCVMLTGDSLGLAPIIALRCIHIVENRPQLSADLTAAVVLRSQLAVRWQVMETTAERCIVETERRGQPGVRRHEWTRAMAERAGLWGRNTWTRYPAAMLRARCTAELGRIVYPDVLAGVYVEGELDDEPQAQPLNHPPVAEPVAERQQERQAFVAFLARVDSASRPWEVWAAWVDLPGELAAEGGNATTEAPGARERAAGALLRLGLALSSAEVQGFLAAQDGGELALTLDDVLRRVPAGDLAAAAEWWAARPAGLAEASLRLVWYALARRGAGLSGCQGAATKAATEALRGAVEKIRARDAAETAETPETMTADDPDAWRCTAEGREAHAATLPHPKAVLASARKHCRLEGYARILAARLVALGGTDAQGTTLSEENALSMVNGEMARAQRDLKARKQET